MRRGLLISLLLVIALGWLWALLGRAPHGTTAEQASEPPAEQPGREPHPPAAAQKPMRARRPDRKRPRPPTQQRRAPPTRAEMLDDPEGYRKRLMEVMRQQREHNTIRLEVAEKRWQKERRDPALAEPWEKAYQQALLDDGIDGMLMDLECRATLCRLELAAVDSNAAFALQGAKNFQNALGTESATTMAGGGFDRVLVLYVPREGYEFEP
ncbi:MAG: hypothetical protein OEZ06_27125 [Myxococcales bacterium]|nr:hypothetical protein [Myxococcales bacterium]